MMYMYIQIQINHREKETVKKCKSESIYGSFAKITFRTKAFRTKGELRMVFLDFVYSQVVISRCISSPGKCLAVAVSCH